MPGLVPGTHAHPPGSFFHEAFQWNRVGGLDDTDLAITPEQQAELDRRLAAHEQDPTVAISWPDLRRELQDRQGK
jgi:putative addiction module component (TIGR02574 family)